MSSVKNQLATTPIERWVKAVEFISISNLDQVEGGRPPSECLTLAELREKMTQIKLEKRNKPSYNWLEYPDGKFYRVWFNESNLTIQFDLHFCNDEYQLNMSYVDLTICTTPKQFTECLYHFFGKSWNCPELLWAFMEVIDEASEKFFGKRLRDAFSTTEELNWVKPTS